MAASAPAVYGEQAGGGFLLRRGLSPTARPGRVLGVSDLILTVVFVPAAGLFLLRDDLWGAVGWSAAGASALLAVGWWNPVGSVRIPALAANVLIAAVVLLPIGARLAGTS